MSGQKIVKEAVPRTVPIKSGQNMRKMMSARSIRESKLLIISYYTKYYFLTKKIYHKKIPAVTHVDGSGRLQTIGRHQNPDYYDLIKEFGKLSGIPILINTSFNIRGEPIVCTPKDAHYCMMGTGIDYLVMGNYLIKRADNPEDIWDSEVSAKKNLENAS